MLLPPLAVMMIVARCVLTAGGGQNHFLMLSSRF